MKSRVTILIALSQFRFLHAESFWKKQVLSTSTVKKCY